MDGANVEIAEEVGEENMFIFGAKIHEVDNIRKKHTVDVRMKKIFDAIKAGTFGDSSTVIGIIDGLQAGYDHYIVCADFDSYV